MSSAISGQSQRQGKECCEEEDEREDLRLV